MRCGSEGSKDRPEPNGFGSGQKDSLSASRSHVFATAEQPTAAAGEAASHPSAGRGGT